MEQTTSTSIARTWKSYVPALDRHLPTWARRSNPIVRRHLGIYWKILPLEIDVLLRIYGVQAVIVLVSIPLPIVLPLMFTLLPVSLVMLPFLAVAYVRVLAHIGMFTTQMIVDEQRNNTLNLLMTTPISLRHILFSKAAAGVWRQVEDLSLILMGVGILSLPISGLQYAAYWPLDESLLVSRFTLLLALAVSILRVVLECFMVSALAIVIGAAVPARIPALTGLGVTGFFYFLLLNLPRVLDLPVEMRILVECILPIVLPLVVIWGSFQLAHGILRRD